MSGLLDLEKEIAYTDGLVLDQLIFKAVDDGWLGMVKARKRKRPVVTFVSGETFTETVELVAEFAQRACFTWQEDKWPSKRVKGA